MNRRVLLRAALFAGVLAALWGGSWLWDRKGLPLRAAADRPLNPLVRVRLGAWRHRPSIPLRLAGRYRVIAEDGRLLFDGAGFEGRLEQDERGARLGLWVVELPSFVIETEGDDGIRVGDRYYRGRLQVGSLADEHTGLPDGFDLSLELRLEDYVLGVICGEMPTTAPGAREALKAQAVAARTYGLWRLQATGRGYLRDDAADQRYHGLDFETAAAREAVEATRGQVLVWDDRLLPAYFHAACGGGTEDARALGFARFKVAPLQGGPDPGCRAAVPWTRQIEAEELDRIAAGFGLGSHLLRLEPESLTRAGRWLKVRLQGSAATKVVPAADLAAAFGTPSTLWTALRPRQDGSLVLEGRGRGHGVGFCQEGALRRAREQEDYLAILGRYYPGARVRPLAELPRLLP